jgi:lipoprotein NlpI
MSLHGCALKLLAVFALVSIAAAQDSEADKLKKDAETAYQSGDFAKCLELTTKVLSQNPKDHKALYLRASAHVELGIVRRDGKELRLGIEDARESLRAGGSGEIEYYLPYMYGMTSLANLENKREHADVVVEVGKNVLARPNLTPLQKSNVLYQRAGAYVSMKNVDAATADFEEAIKANPQHLGAHVGLAESYDVAGQSNKALAAFSAAVDAFPNNPLVFNNRGLFLQRQGQLKDAVTDFNKALQIDPKFAVAYANRGFTYQAERNLAAAETDFSQAIAQDPKHPLFYRLRGTCRLSQLNTDGAIEDYNHVIRLDPQNPVGQADLGFAKFFARDYVGAQTSFDQAVAMNASMRYLNPWRAWTLVLQGRVDALPAIMEATIKRPEADRDWIDQMVLFLNGKISEQDLVRSIDILADRAAEKGVDKETLAPLKNAQLCEAYYFIAERRSQAGDKANATAFYQQVLKTNLYELSAYRGAQFATRK